VEKNSAPYWLDLNHNYLNASSCIRFIIHISKSGAIFLRVRISVR
jgi:hypothetical protein